MNSVILIGRLTKDPEVRYTGDQMAVASFTLAVDRPKRADKEKETDFPRITVFGKQAENCERYLTKGKLAAVQGKIQTGSYTNKDGQKVYTTDVVANQVQFLEWGEKTERTGQDGEGSQTKHEDGIPSGFQVVDDDDIPW